MQLLRMKAEDFLERCCSFSRSFVAQKKDILNCDNKKERPEDRLREKSLTSEKIKRLEKEVQELFNKIRNVDKT